MFSHAVIKSSSLTQPFRSSSTAIRALCKQNGHLFASIGTPHADAKYSASCITPAETFGFTGSETASSAALCIFLVFRVIRKHCFLLVYIGYPFCFNQAKNDRVADHPPQMARVTAGAAKIVTVEATTAVRIMSRNMQHPSSPGTRRRFCRRRSGGLGRSDDESSIDFHCIAISSMAM